jgi:glycosyltransferase involved in cell wall biosynthesis
MKLGLNGRYLAAPTGGVRRFAECIGRGVLAEVGGVLFLPAGVDPPPDLPDGVQVSSGRFDGHAWEQAELPRAAARAGCDVVLHLANTLPLRKGPHVATVHDVTPLTDPRWFRRRYTMWHRWFVRPALRRAAALLTVSEWSAGEIRRVLRVPPERVAPVPQGVAPLDAPATSEAVARVRRRFELERPYLLAVGTRDPRKNVAFLAGVVARLEAQGHPCALVLAGAPESGRVWAAPPALPPAPWLVPVGEVDDETLRALYTGAAALCHPALAEGFGRPPLEAMACGTPVVAAPYGSAREVLGRAAEIVFLDPDAWATALVRVMSEPPGRRTRRTARARARVARYRWEDGVRRVLEVCHTVARRP